MSRRRKRRLWKDIEADEATFDRRDISQHVEFKHLIQSKDCAMMWEQWAGIIQRGRPETLVLRNLQPKITVKRAPGPGAIRKIEWKALGSELLPVPGSQSDPVHRLCQELQAQASWGPARQGGSLQKASEGQRDMAVATPPLCADRHPQVARY